MNCNDAFDLMTTPDGHNDPALRQHLAECPRCQAMQETLSPALSWLMASANSDGEHRRDNTLAELFLTEEAVQVAERAARRLHARQFVKASPNRLRTSTRAWLSLAGIAAMLCCAIWAFSESPTRNGARPPHVSAAVAACLWKLPEDELRRSAPTAEQLVAMCAACHLASQ